MRICLLVQGTWVRALVWGESHMPRSNWAREPQLLSLRIWSLCSATREAAIVRGPRTAMKSGPHLPQLEKALAWKQRPNIAINQSINKSKKNFLKIKNQRDSDKISIFVHKRQYRKLEWLMELMVYIPKQAVGDANLPLWDKKD